MDAQPFSFLQSMKYKITKMNGRYTTYGYQYLIEFSKTNFGTGVLDFDRTCRWFVEHYGWSQDVETRQHMQENRSYWPDAYQSTDINPVWAHCSKYGGTYRIYVNDDRTLSWFLLCHPVSQ